jgi:hypothetical protein
MTVKELIEELSQLPMDAQVIATVRGGDSSYSDYISTTVCHEKGLAGITEETVVEID